MWTAQALLMGLSYFYQASHVTRYINTPLSAFQGPAVARYHGLWNLQRLSRLFQQQSKQDKGDNDDASCTEALIEKLTAEQRQELLQPPVNELSISPSGSGSRRNMILTGVSVALATATGVAATNLYLQTVYTRADFRALVMRSLLLQLENHKPIKVVSVQSRIISGECGHEIPGRAASFCETLQQHCKRTRRRRLDGRMTPTIGGWKNTVCGPKTKRFRMRQY